MERYKHQVAIFNKTKDLEFFALMWEMRVGKTWPMLDTAKYLYDKGKIDTVVIITLNGVHLKWSRIDIPEYLDQEYGEKPTPQKRDHIITEWDSSKLKQEKYQDHLNKNLTHPGLVWVCANFEGLTSRKKPGEQKKEASQLEIYLYKLLKTRRVLIIFDESHKLKNPTANRTKAGMRLSKLAKFRRILTGSPVGQGPFDLWSQFYLLSPSILGEHFRAFKTRYGVFKRVSFGGPYFDKLDYYRDLPHLYSLIEPHSDRLTEAEANPNLPPMVSDIRVFEMSSKQKRAYDQLRDDLITKLDNDQGTVTAQQAIVSLIRLQQISRGFVGGVIEDLENPEAATKTVDLGEPHPSIECLTDILEDVSGKAIVWCNFKRDIDLIMESIRLENSKRKEEDRIGTALRLDGSTPSKDRPEILKRFKDDPKVKFIISAPSVGGTGYDMSSADTTIFYSHGYNLTQRQQAVARMKGPNQKSKSLLLIDMVCLDSTDRKCLKSLATKAGIAAILTGDSVRENLRNLLR